MSIDISTVTDPTAWNELVERSPQTTPFHRFEALEVQATHADATLHPLVGYKGEEPVGLFPVFSLSRGPARGALSPPPDLKVPYLGPALLDSGGLKQRKAEKRHRRFVEAIDEEISDEIDPHYVHVRSGPAYADPRPFIWNDYEPTPRYTYEVDITPEEEDLFMTFSGDIRENVRRADEDGYELLEGDAEDVARIIDLVRERHEDQDVSFDVPTSFARDLYHELPAGRMRAYVCQVDGEFAGGEVTLEDERTLYGWQAAANYDLPIAVTDLVCWHLIRDGRERGLERYDLGGANDPRLCSYKAKYNPTVETYYELERSNRMMDGLKGLYRRFG
ncbi:lipid II:glycine glycyltransferase FemX [Natrialbaceae archaeon A-gly3]